MEHNQSKLSPKFFFLSLGVLVSLIATVTAFLNLAFQTLDKKFPDALNAVYQYGYNTYSFEAARAALATLIIVFPAYLILSYFWSKASKRDLGRIDDVIRKWMLYLILFLVGIVIIVDLVTLVRYFVSGEITTRFIIKVLVTLVVAVSVGGYYMFELRGWKKFGPFPVALGSAIKAVIFVVALVVWSFSVIGTPNEQRAWRLDERRTQDLQSIQWSVISFWQQKEKLPESLDEMKDPISSYMIPFDPEFQKGLAYEYRKTADMTFELCATFSAVMPQGWQEGYGGVRPMLGGVYMEDSVASYPYPGGGGNESWDHQVGRTCFSRTIDPDVYPVFEKDIRAL